MLKKLTILGAMSAVMLSAPVPQAKADVGFNFNLNTPGFGLYLGDNDRRHYRGDRHRYRHYRVHRIGCGEARRIVRRNGFHRVRATDCSGRIYTFRARKHGELYRVRVNARGGHITRIRRLS